MAYVFRLFVCVAAIVLASRTTLAGIVTFDTDPDWAVVGTGQNANDFGFRTTNFAGGSPGEGGGRFTRSSFVRSYADTNVGPFSLDDPLAASGLLNIASFNFPDFGPGLVLGHFDIGSPAAVGFLFNNNDAGGMYADIVVRFSDGTEARTSVSGSIQAGVTRDWTFDWDPAGGTAGYGALSASLSGVDGGSATLELTASERAMLIGLNAFGLSSQATSPLSGNRDRADWYGDFFIDDVAYTSVVPEPSTGLMAVIMVVLALARRSTSLIRRSRLAADCGIFVAA